MRSTEIFPINWSLAPLVLIRTTNLPMEFLERLGYERTKKIFERKLQGDLKESWSGKEIEYFKKDEQTFREKVISILKDKRFWDIHYPFIFKHGSYVFNNRMAFRSFPKAKLSSSDFNFFYKRISHMVTRNALTFNFNSCIPGETKNKAPFGLSIPHLKSPGEKRILLECWAQKALSKRLGTLISLIKSGTGEVHFAPSLPSLNQLEISLNKFLATNNPKKERMIFEECKVFFNKLTGVGYLRKESRFREVVSFFRVQNQKFIVGGALLSQLQSISNSLGKILESFSYYSSIDFIKLVKQGAPIDEAVKRAIDRGIKSFDSHFQGSPQGFFFGIDFMVNSPSLSKINKGDYEIIVSDVNTFPGGFEIFISENSSLGNLAKNTARLISKALLDAAENNPSIVFLHDSEAIHNNQRWRERIKTIFDSLEDFYGIAPREMNFYPKQEGQLKLDCAAFFWFLRQGFFSFPNKQAIEGIRKNVFNHYFFCYAIQHREILQAVIERVKTENPEIPIKIRKSFSLNIDDFLKKFIHKSTFSKAATTLSDWFAIYRFFLDANFPRYFFLKTEETKLFSPLCIDINNLYSIKIFISSLQRLKARGIKKVLVEEMAPLPENFWLEKSGGRYPCELRTFVINKL